jgi:hypothetical protein
MAKRSSLPIQSNKRLAEYLRSIDVELDAGSPERCAHFCPTEKSVQLINGLGGFAEDRAHIFVAPYGSGKSLAASYLLHLLENRPDSRPALKQVEPRLNEVCKQLAGWAKQRRTDEQIKGLVLPLSGPIHDLHLSVKTAVLSALKRFNLGRQARPLASIEVTRPEDLFPFLNACQDKLLELGFDRIAIVWDEFGKHLEYLVQEGRTSQLFHVQRLAEYVARSKMPMTLGLFMHMGFLHYTSNISQAARKEWMKVEGRFKTTDYVDDSNQVYFLLGRVISQKRSSAAPDKAVVKDWMTACRTHHLFKEMKDDELNSLIENSYPFTPPAVYLLPRLTGRVAQNERTLFHFINQWDGQADVRPAELFDYFSPQLRADISTGGTHRQWLEINSALLKADGNENAEAVIKTAGIFGLGALGRNSGASLDLLKRSWQGHQVRAFRKNCPVKQMLDRKLLLHRPFKDEVTVWHGTDLDLRGHLDGEKAKRGPGFELLEFLNKNVPAPYRRPLSYNSEFRIRRFFSGVFATVGEYESKYGPGCESPISGADGRIVYLLPETPKELVQALKLVKQENNKKQVVAIPREAIPLAETALEVHCLYKMQEDKELISADPLALDEIRQITVDSEAGLHSMLRRCIEPSNYGPQFFYQGKSFKAESLEALREELSSITRKVYSKTPKLNNELINKNSPTSVVINSRKKLVLGILERAGLADLGLPETTPDASMFRTLLVETGIYRENENGLWGFAGHKAESIKDKNLRHVWQIIGGFVSEPCEEGPKCLEGLKDRLMEAPIGLRDGVFPILLAAGVKSFGGMTIIRKNGALLEDVLPTNLEDMNKSPESYFFDPVALDKIQAQVLADFAEVFGTEEEDAGHGGLLQDANEGLAAWRADLPRCAIGRDFGDEPLNRFRDAVFSEMDGVQFFRESLVSLVGGLSSRERIKTMQRWRGQLETADKIYFDHIAKSMRAALELAQDEDLLLGARERAGLFSSEFLGAMPDVQASQLLRRMGMKYETEEKLCGSVAQLLTEKRVSDFDDRGMAAFDKRLKVLVDSIDRAADWAEDSLFGEELRSWMIANRRKRIKELFMDLVRLESDATAREYLQSLSAKKKEAH